MTTLHQRIQDDIKAAMKGGQKDELAVLRMLMSDLKNLAISEGLDRQGMDDELVLRAVRKGIKSRKESAAMYAEAGRADLEETERFQIGVLERYQPAQMSEAELEVIVDTVIVASGASTKKEMGAVMKAVLEKVGGRADGKTVSRIVGARLA